ESRTQGARPARGRHAGGGSQSATLLTRAATPWTGQRRHARWQVSSRRPLGIWPGLTASAAVVHRAGERHGTGLAPRVAIVEDLAPRAVGLPAHHFHRAASDLPALAVGLPDTLLLPSLFPSEGAVRGAIGTKDEGRSGGIRQWTGRDR